MTCRAVHMWSLSGLVAAFLDLAIAYLLLCASALAFFASKFLGFLGLSLPCPCDGLFFNVPLKEYCLGRLLVDFPTQNVSNVHFSVKQKFPFDDSRSSNYVNKFIEMEGETSCSSVADSRRRKHVAGEELSVEKYDVKGKGVIIGRRPRSRLRERRKGGGRGGGLYSSVSSHDPSQYEDADMNRVSVRSSSPLPKYEDIHTTKNILSIEDLQDTSQRIEFLSGDEKNTIRILEQELEEERNAHAALYIELEKERSAAASAADEAMAMILRLQEEKAFIEMDARQYQRILEEKSAYDAEEMNILKEILMRREKEKLFLEKEVEEYRQNLSLGNEQSAEVSGNIFNLAFDLDDDPHVMLSQLAESTELPLCDSVGNMKLQEKEVLSADNNSYLTGNDAEECKFVKPLEEKELAEIEEVNLGHKPEENVILACNGKDVMLNEDAHVYDVHVIGDPVHEVNYDSSEASVTKKGLDFTEVNVKRSNSDLPPVGPNGKSLLCNLRRSSMSAVDSEMLKIDSEVSKLRERLKVVQDGRDKLSFSVDSRERENTQLKLLEDITRQIQEIRYLTEPGLSENQVLSKKRRCRSVSSGLHRSSKG